MLVDIVLDDPALFDEMLKSYPEVIKEDQIRIDDAIEMGDKRQYWFSKLNYKTLMVYLDTNGSGNYAIFRSVRLGKHLLKVSGLSVINMN